MQRERNRQGSMGRLMRGSELLKSPEGPQDIQAGQSSPTILFRSTSSFQKAPSVEGSPPHAFLRGGSQEKMFCGAAVSMKRFPKQGGPAIIPLPSQREKVTRYLFPCPARPLWGAYAAQVVPPPEHGMGTPESSKGHSHPARHQPGGHLTIGLNLHRGPVEPPLPPLPTSQAQEQGPQQGTGRVLEIRNQLDGQKGHGVPTPSAQESSNGNPFLLEDREQLDRIPPIGSDLPTAVLIPTDGAGSSDQGEEINPTTEERFFVFPNRLICVRVGKLNCSAALPTGGRTSALTPLSLPLCGSWLFFQGQFLTSLFPLPLYHRLENPVNTAQHAPSYNESNNTLCSRP
jgi:hypothetical protein